MPTGWRFEEREGQVVYAVVRGNPILLEEQARSLGYSRALADSPNSLLLGEID